MGLVSHRRLQLFSPAPRALLRACGLSGAELSPHEWKNKISLEWKKRDEPLTYILALVRHSFLDVFAFDNGSQGASM